MIINRNKTIEMSIKEFYAIAYIEMIGIWRTVTNPPLLIYKSGNDIYFIKKDLKKQIITGIKYYKEEYL